MDVDAPKATSSAKPKPKSPVKPQVASIFAKKPAKPAASTSKGKDAKGKGKAVVESEEEEDGPSAPVVRKGSAEPDEDGEDSDESESSEEETAAVKMCANTAAGAADHGRAEIFTKKQIGASKPGAGGKTVEWEAGQPYVCASYVSADPAVCPTPHWRNSSPASRARASAWRSSAS